MISLVWNLKKKTRDHRYKEQIGGCQRQEVRKKGGRLQKVQTFSYKISHGDIIYSILCVCVLVTQLCLTLCDPMDCSPPSSSVHGILQARILEWVAAPSSRGSSRPGDRTHISSISCIGRRVLYHQRHREAHQRNKMVLFIKQIETQKL